MARGHVNKLVLIYLVILVLDIQQTVTAYRVKRIINGQESDHSESTWLVSLQAEKVTRRRWGIPVERRHFYCGGTIINDRWILTAAHCFDGILDPDEWHARFGSEHRTMSAADRIKHVFSSIRRDWRQYEYHPETIERHPNYTNYGWGNTINDIALVKLKETIPVSLDRVGVIDLNFDDNTLDLEQDCSIYGWGCSAPGGDQTKHINRADMTLISNDLCRRKLTSLDLSGKLCAEGNGTACAGDAGGPLVCKTVSGKRVQTGVISSVDGVNPTEYPVVFTKVLDYKEWIQQTIRT